MQTFLCHLQGIPKIVAKAVLRRGDVVVINATSETGTVMSADNVKGRHLVRLHDSQIKRLFLATEIRQLSM